MSPNDEERPADTCEHGEFGPICEFCGVDDGDPFDYPEDEDDWDDYGDDWDDDDDDWPDDDPGIGLGELEDFDDD